MKRETVNENEDDCFVSDSTHFYQTNEADDDLNCFTTNGKRKIEDLQSDLLIFTEDRVVIPRFTDTSISGDQDDQEEEDEAYRLNPFPRCEECYLPYENDSGKHDCPAYRNNESHMKKNIFDWKYCTSEGTRELEADEEACTVVTVRRTKETDPDLSMSIQNFRKENYEFIITSVEEEQLLASDIKMVSNNYTVIPIKDISDKFIVDEDFMESITCSIKKSIVHGHGTQTRNVDDIIKALINEFKLKWYLLATGHKLLNEFEHPGEISFSEIAPTGPFVNLQLGKQLHEFHSMDDGFMFLFGENESMKALASQLTSDLATSTRLSTSALAVFALDLNHIIGKSSSQIIEELTKLAKGDKKLEKILNREIILGDRLQSNFMEATQMNGIWTESDFLPHEQVYMPWNSSKALLPVSQISVLIAMWIYPDAVIFDVPGGKRSLGETSLDSALRQTNDEIKLDLKDSYVRESGIENSLPIESGPWYLCSNLKYNAECYIYLHESMINWYYHCIK